MNILSVNKPDRNLDAEKRGITGEVAGEVSGTIQIEVCYTSPSTTNLDFKLMEGI